MIEQKKNSKENMQKIKVSFYFAIFSFIYGIE